MRFTKLFCSLLLIAFIALPSIASSFDGTYRFRLTINVERNGVMHSGSSVIELSTFNTGSFAGLDNIQQWETHARGEAVFVDLGNGMNLIALLASGSEFGYEQTVLLPSRVILGDAATKKQGLLRFDTLTAGSPPSLAEAKGKVFPVAMDKLPPLVQFKKLSDPTTVERVDPAMLSASFGAGTVFKGAVLEITTDPVSLQLSKYLPWLDALKPNKSLSGGFLTVDHANELPFSNPGQIAYRNFSTM